MTPTESDMYNSLDRNITAHIDLPSWTTKDLYVVPFYPSEPPSDPIVSYQGRTKAFGTDINCTLLPVEEFPSGWGDEGYLNISMGFNGTCLSKRKDLLVLRDTPRSTFGGNGEVYQNAECPGTIYPFWAQRYSFSDIRVIALSCEVTEIAYELTATVSSTQRILNTSDERALPAVDLLSLYPQNDTVNLPPGYITNDFVSSLTLPRVGRRTEYTQLVWINYFMNILHPAVYNQSSGEITYLPNTTEIAPAFEDIYRRLFAIKLRLNDYVLMQGDSYREVGTLALRLNRVMTNYAMTAIAGGVILYTILVLLAIFLQRKPVPRGHLPTCLVGFYASLYASTVKDDIDFGVNPHRSTGILQQTYAYGWFLSDDGEWHYGICRKSEVKAQRDIYAGKPSQGDITETDTLSWQGRDVDDQSDVSELSEVSDEYVDIGEGGLLNYAEGIEEINIQQSERDLLNSPRRSLSHTTEAE